MKYTSNRYFANVHTFRHKSSQNSPTLVLPIFRVVTEVLTLDIIIAEKSKI